jgi:hypothetical protein
LTHETAWFWLATSRLAGSAFAACAVFALRRAARGAAGASRSRPAEPFRLGAHAAILFPGVVVPTQEVEQTVGEEHRQLREQRAFALGSLLSCGGDAHNDITQERPCQSREVTLAPYNSCLDSVFDRRRLGRKKRLCLPIEGDAPSRVLGGGSPRAPPPRAGRARRSASPPFATSISPRPSRDPR